MRYRVLPYKQGSRSAGALAAALGGKVLKLIGSTFKPKAGDVIINWGNTSLQDHGYPHDSMLNHSDKITFASNKLKFFRLLKDTGLTPNFWEKKDDIPDTAFPIVCRTVLAGHSGDGIHIAYQRDQLVDCLLYVQYVKKKDEYRIHVGRSYTQNGPVIVSVQRKAKKSDAENVNWQVRNHANGFVYVRNEVNPPQRVLDAATAAFEATGLDFGAVDVIDNVHSEKAYVLEINTAPGLEGQTVTDYATYFKGQ